MLGNEVGSVGFDLLRKPTQLMGTDLFMMRGLAALASLRVLKEEFPGMHLRRSVVAVRLLLPTL